MARKGRAVAAREESKPVLEAGRDSFDPERSDACCGQLDRKGNTVEMPANPRLDRCQADVRHVPRVRRMRPSDKQLDRSVLEHVFHIKVVLRGHLERRYLINVLPFCSQRLAAGSEHARGRAGAQQCLGHACRLLDDMLAVVQYQQNALRAQRGGDALG